MAGMNVYEMDISYLFSGIYLYDIIVDGMIVKSGKISIIK